MPKAEVLTLRRIEAIPISMPLLKPVLMGGGQKFTHSESLIVRVESVSGIVGWGEASAAPSMTGDTLPGMVEAVDRHLAPRLIGQNALERVRLAEVMFTAIIGNTGAKAACDIALHDLAGKHLGVPVVDLLGGKARNSLVALNQLGNPTIKEDVAEARAKARKGYKFFGSSGNRVGEFESF